MCGRWRRFGRTLYKSFGVSEIGGVKNGLSFFDNALGLAMMEDRRSQQADAGMMVFLVVPVDKVGGKGSGIFDGAEPIRELGPVLRKRPVTTALTA
jgi:hypothetical protein